MFSIPKLALVSPFPNPFLFSSQISACIIITLYFLNCSSMKHQKNH